MIFAAILFRISLSSMYGGIRGHIYVLCLDLWKTFGFKLKKLLSGIFVALVYSTLSVASAKACEDLIAGPKGRVIEVVDGDTVVLDSDIRVRLIGIQAPKLPLGRDGFESWPLALQAKQELERLTLDKNVEIRYGGARMDRHGRVLGHMFIGPERIWAQGAMVREGLARVYSFPDNRFCLSELYRIEAQARADRVGIWNGEDFYRIRDGSKPQKLLERLDQYEIVEGRVINADRVRQRIYLNFGKNWQEDFTIVIERAGLRRFEEAGIDPLMFENALIRVRGWVEERDGPRIEVTHPEQIELLARP